jgi:hypothetical protein
MTETKMEKPRTEEQACDFTDAVQKRIAAMLLFDEVGIKDNIKIIHPDFFDNPALKAITFVAQTFYEEYHRPINVDELIQEFEIFINSQKGVPIEEYWKVAEEVISLQGEDTTYPRDKALEFARYQAIRRAIIDGAEIVKRGGDYNKILDKVLAALELGAKDTAGDVMETIDGNLIEPKEASWLWPERIQLGRLTLIVGDPESGKSLFTMWMAAHVTTGTSWPDNCMPPVGRVLILQSEEDPNETMMPRLNQYGADPSKVTYVTGIKTAEGQDRTFTLLQDVARLKKEILHRGDVKMVIMDPIQGYFGGALSGKVNTNSDAHIRAILGPLKTMAEETGVAVVGVAHLNKASQNDMIYRIGGSIAIMAVARSVWLIKWDRDPDGLRYFQSMKSNRKAGIAGLAFNIDKNNGDVTFQAVPVPSATDLLSPTYNQPGTKEATRWLREQVASGPKNSKFLFSAGEQEGFSKAMIYGAKKVLGLKARRIGEEGKGAGHWEWSLS